MDVDDRFLAELSDRRLADFTRIPLAWISGVEVTQSIQYYKASEHLSDPNDRGADNTVRLVASKPAWVRVYYRSILARRPTVTLTSGRWLVDADEAGAGFESWVTAPPAGEHRVTFALDRGPKVTVSFRTADPEADFGSEPGRNPGDGD